jgi:hypothetical protein
MTAWTPEYKVFANGTEVTDITLVGFSITSGRQDINTQAQAGYCNLRIVNLTNQSYPWTINTGITIEVKNSQNVYVSIFGGRVSDLSVGVEDVGSEAVVTTVQLFALGALSKIQNVLWTGSLVKDEDGLQIAEILNDLLINTWNEVSPSEQWSTYNTTETWANAQNIGVGTIDPGQYEMISRNADPINAYSLIAEIANSGLGYLFEDANGRISYGDAARRTTNLINNGFTEFNGNHALADGIRTVTRQGDLCNNITINYKNNFGTSYSFEDTVSQSEYGIFARNINSRIDDDPDAEDVAERFVQLRANPFPRFEEITFAIQNPELSDTERDALIGVYMGLPISISNLPPNINGGSFAGYVEGWTFRSTLSGLSVTLTLSSREFSSFTINWAQAGNTLEWTGVNATLTWENATGALI